MLCTYLEREQTHGSRPASPDQLPQALVFRLLFTMEGASLDGDGWPVRRDMLCKLVSMAVATQAKRVLECVAFWIQVSILGGLHGRTALSKICYLPLFLV